MNNEKSPNELEHGNIQAMDCFEFEEDICPPSPISSSPPRDFNVHPEGQYMPIIDIDDEENDEDKDPRNDQTSLASSLSLEPDSPCNATHTSATAIAPANSSRVIRCPVCEKPMRTFYCAKCILRGRFVTLEHNQRTTDATPELYCPDSITYERKYKTKFGISSSISSTSSSTIVHDNSRILEDSLKIKLRALTKKTEALKALYEEQQLKLQETKNIIKQTRQQMELEKKSYRAKESKIDLIKRFVNSRRASVKKRHDAEMYYLDEMKQHVSRRVYQLAQDVYPIEELNLLEQNSSFNNMETSPLLTFSDGSHHQIEQTTAYTIVEPWLPSDGDYSAYSLWVNDNREQIQAPIDDSPERNPAFRIGAALAYTTQLVRNLASYLDVILPARLELDTFSRELLNDAEFSHHVAKLNANVIHLCVSQGINISLLNSQRTLKNLLLLYDMNLCDLGRKPIFEFSEAEDDKIACKIESRLTKDLILIRDDFYDFSKFSIYDNDEDDDVSDSEWEISDTIHPMDLQLAEQSIQQNSYITRPLRLFSSFWTASGGS